MSAASARPLARSRSWARRRITSSTTRSWTLVHRADEQRRGPPPAPRASGSGRRPAARPPAARPGSRPSGSAPDAERHLEVAVGPLRAARRRRGSARPPLLSCVASATARRSSFTLSPEDRDGAQHVELGVVVRARSAAPDSREVARFRSDWASAMRPSSTASPASSSRLSAARRCRPACSSRNPAARPINSTSAPTPSEREPEAPAGLPRQPPTTTGWGQRLLPSF